MTQTATTNKQRKRARRKTRAQVQATSLLREVARCSDAPLAQDAREMLAAIGAWVTQPQAKVRVAAAEASDARGVSAPSRVCRAGASCAETALPEHGSDAREEQTHGTT